MPTWSVIALVVASALLAYGLGLAVGRPSRATTEPDPDDATPPPTSPPGRADGSRSAAGRLVEQMRPAAVVISSGDDLVLANEAARDNGLVHDGRLVVRDLLEISREVRRDGPLTRDLALPRSLGRASGRTLGVDAVVLDPEGTVGLVVHDVTEARRLEAVRRDFVANVSHELKTPVGALTLLAEAVQDAAEDPEAIRRFAGRMLHEGDRLTRLVRELIDLSRLQGGEPMPPLAEVRLAALVAEACDRIRLAADAKDICLVHSGEAGLVVPAVEAQVAMAVSNLLANAVAYSQPGTKVAIGYRRRGTHAEITVTDEGIGIPGRDLGRIFERFYRVDPARSSATGGTGLGLSIVKHVATNHGGAVDVWSVEGQGSTFTLRLPLPSTSPVEPPADKNSVDVEEPVEQAAAVEVRPGVPIRA